jgi:hypothetical protein
MEFTVANQENMWTALYLVPILIQNPQNIDSIEEVNQNKVKGMKCPNQNCNNKIDTAKQKKTEGNFYCCTDCGTIIYRKDTQHKK